MTKVIQEIVKSSIPKFRVCARWNDTAVHIHDEEGRATISRQHYHDEIELLPIRSGSLHCVAEGVEYVGKVGDIIFVNSRVPHSTYATEPTIYGLLQFRETDFIDTEILKVLKYSARLSTLDSASVRILRIEDLFDSICSLIDEVERAESGYDFFVRGYIFHTLGILYRNGIISNPEQLWASKDIQRVVSALSYINEYYSDVITLDQMSEMLGFDPSYFCRVFKSAIGATFTEYLNFVRVCKAETLLAKTNDSILDISERVGFSSPSYFNRVFKRYLNISPKHYRTAKYIAISKGENE